MSICFLALQTISIRAIGSTNQRSAIQRNSIPDTDTSLLLTSTRFQKTFKRRRIIQAMRHEGCFVWDPHPNNRSRFIKLILIDIFQMQSYQNPNKLIYLTRRIQFIFDCELVSGSQPKSWLFNMNFLASQYCNVWKYLPWPVVKFKQL